MRNLLITLLLINSCVFATRLAAQLSNVPIYVFANNPEEHASIETISKLTKSNEFSVVNIAYRSKFERLINSGSIGVYYVPPHFANWLTHAHNFKSLLTLNEKLSYYVIVHQDNTNIFELSDLASQRVCVKAPLSMDFLYFRSQFQDAVSAPVMYSVTDPEQVILNDSSHCDAYVVNNHQAERVFTSKPEEFIKLARSESFDNYQFIAHPDVDKKTLVAIRQWLLQHQTTLAPLFKQNSTLASLISTSDNDNTDHLLEELSKYWQERSVD